MSGLGRRHALLAGSVGAAAVLTACTRVVERGLDEALSQRADDAQSAAVGAAAAASPGLEGYELVEGSRTDRGFVVDHLLRTPDDGEIHVSLSVPEDYDLAGPAPLYVALPGWEGLWFQGVGAHLSEDFPFVAREQVPQMVIASPQLEDWGQTSARQVVALTQWLLGTYRIDPSRVILSGCSGGGETASIVMGLRPELFAAVLHVISRWSGDIQPLVEAQVPVYMAIGEEDDYYGAQPDIEAYAAITQAYQRAGLPEERVKELVTLDVRPSSYFGQEGLQRGQHAAGGALFPHDEQVMGWLLDHVR